MLAYIVILLYNHDMNNYEITTNSATETELFAENLAKTFVGGEVLLLHGDLGAGKTHFVKGLAKGLDIDDVITSPTFALHNSYEGRVTLNHFDFYRIDDPEEVAILGLDDFFYDKHAIAAIEWSENIKELLPRKYIDVTIDKLDETTRKITIREIS